MTGSITIDEHVIKVTTRVTSRPPEYIGEICRLESEAAALGDRNTLTHAMHLLGFQNWADTARFAREGNRVAVELLACRVERLSPSV